MAVTLIPAGASTGSRAQGILQLAAGIALIESSHLMQFQKECSSFLPEAETTFERNAHAQHPKFGRVMLWILFSTGAEYLLKASFLLAGIWNPTVKSKRGIPPHHFSSVENLSEAVATLPSEDVNDFSTMGPLIDRFNDLFAARGYTNEFGQSTVREAYKILSTVIRNRDSHAYVENVRAGQHSVMNLLCPAFNILLSWVDTNDLAAALTVQTSQSS